MGYLDDIPERFTPPGQKRYRPQDNFEELQNDGHEIVADDFSDSPFADRKEVPPDE